MNISLWEVFRLCIAVLMLTGTIAIAVVSVLVLYAFVRGVWQDSPGEDDDV